MFNFSRFLRFFIGISGAFSVLFGAWLAHAGQVLPNEVISRLNSAHLYQFLHTIVLLLLLVWFQNSSNKTVKIAAIGFMLGILLFSGSLYIKTFTPFIFMGKLAPFGGIMLALSWLALLFAGTKKL